MMRKFIFSLMFLFFMIILATCSMVKEEKGQAWVNPGLPAATLNVNVIQTPSIQLLAQ